VAERRSLFYIAGVMAGPLARLGGRPSGPGSMTPTARPVEMPDRPETAHQRI